MRMRVKLMKLCVHMTRNFYALLFLVAVIALCGACGADETLIFESNVNPRPEFFEIRERLFELEEPAGVSIVGLVAGDELAVPIVLVPGSGRSAMQFLDFIPLLVEAGFWTVALSPRGVEGSQGPLDELTLHHYAADIAGVIERLGVGPVHVLGYGEGNRIVRCLAADRGDLVRSIILLGAGGQFPGEREALEALGRLGEPGRSQEERREDLQTALFAPASDASVWLDLPLFPEIQESQDAAGRITPREEWLTAGNAPTLVVQGRYDRIAPPANGRWLREHLGDRVQLVELANSGHALIPEQPAEIVEAIRDFTGSL